MASGNEDVTLKQFKVWASKQGGGGGGKKYKIRYSGIVPTWIKTEAYPGEVIIIANDQANRYGYSICDDSCDLTVCNPSSADTLDYLPPCVKEALADIPQTNAAPPAEDGYAWFIMPPCDVVLYPY